MSSFYSNNGGANSGGSNNNGASANGNSRGSFYNSYNNQNTRNFNNNVNPNANNSNNNKFNNRSNKNRNKNYNNQNNNQESQQFNSFNSDYNGDQVGHSLPPENFTGNNRGGYNKFTKFESNNFGNNLNVPVRKPNNNNKRRGNGNGNGYYNNKRGAANNSFNEESDFVESINERLNKSFPKEENLFGQRTGIPSSFSLDNLGYSNVASFKRNSPTKMSNSFSFVNTTSPSKCGVLPQVETIEEQDTDTANKPTSPETTTTPQLVINSVEIYAESPVVHILKPESAASSTASSSPDSQNMNGYETGESQLLVTASEGEMSFGNEQTIITATETSFSAEFDSLVIKSLVHTEIMAATAEHDDSTTSIEAESSDSSSITPEEQTTEEHSAAPTIHKEESPSSSLSSNSPNESSSSSSSSAQTSTTSASLSTTASSSSSSSSSPEKNEVEPIQKIEETKSGQVPTNEEISMLVNKIVLDVISQAIQVSPTQVYLQPKDLKKENAAQVGQAEEIADFIKEDKTIQPGEIADFIKEDKTIQPGEIADLSSLIVANVIKQAMDLNEEKEATPVEHQISFGEKDEPVVFKRPASLETSMEVVKTPVCETPVLRAEGRTDETSNLSAALQKTIATPASATSSLNTSKINKTKPKESIVDCFSCSII